MAKNKATFEDYLRTYIQNQAISATKEGYSDWLRRNGKNSEKIYTEQLRDIDTGYRRARSEHGATAERLASLGLGESGYADYLNGAAYYEMQRKKLLAKEKKESLEKENAAGYSDYLEKYSAKLKKAFNSAIDGIESAKITDYSAAYEYAKNSGLSESDASAAAKLATESVVKKIKETILKEITSKKLTEKETSEYAKALGLSDEDAKELSEYARSVNETVYVKKYPDFYKPKSE